MWPLDALVEAAAEAGFQCILTRDRVFGASAARALWDRHQHNREARQPLRGPEFLSEFQASWERGRIAIVPGKFLRWPEG